MKSPNRIQAVIACAFLLASCSKTPTSEFTGIEITPELRAIMESGRASAFPPLHPDFWEVAADLLTPLDPDEDLRVAEAVRLNADPNMTVFSPGRELPGPGTPVYGSVNRGEAVEDTHFLFDVLRNGYTGYGYFGGDSAFLPARDSVLAALEAGEGPIQRKDFLDLLVRAIGSLIADNHFILYNIRFFALSNAAYISEEILMRHTESGLVAEIEGRTYRVLGAELVDGTPVEAIMPTLTKEGEIAWMFGRLLGHPDRELIALLEDGQSGERLSRRVSLSRMEGPQFGGVPMLGIREEVGVTVLENRTLVGGWKDAEERSRTYAEFYRAGQELRNRPVLILDLRGHRGGFQNAIHEWTRGYTGIGPSDNAAFLPFVLATRTAEELGADVPDDPNYTDNLNYSVQSNRWLEDPNRRAQWLPPKEWDRSLLPNKNLVVVLIDHHVASAGEIFVGYLRQLENVLFVGTNTSGTLATGGVVRTKLPHSRFNLQFGIAELHLRPDLSQFEGVGLLPDLWVPPGESLERVLAFIERYGIRR
ncbi:MAG: S41 family peptidase [Treponema sp.]|nr:S41 family peptidase [Treponema sp.]